MRPVKWYSPICWYYNMACVSWLLACDVNKLLNVTSVMKTTECSRKSWSSICTCYKRKYLLQWKNPNLWTHLYLFRMNPKFTHIQPHSQVFPINDFECLAPSSHGIFWYDPLIIHPHVLLEFVNLNIVYIDY
jgi:hypothetical protein